MAEKKDRKTASVVSKDKPKRVGGKTPRTPRRGKKVKIETHGHTRSKGVTNSATPSDLVLEIDGWVLSDYAALQAEAGSKEIGGIGIVETVSDNVIRLVKIFVATSQNTGSLNVMNAGEVGAAIYRAAQMGLYNRDYALFWHSHPGFGCFWSATDVSAIEDQIVDGGKVINLVFSTPGVAKARLDYIPDYAEFRAAREKEEKELIKKHQQEAKDATAKKIAEKKLVGAKLSSIKSIKDVPTYMEIVDLLAKNRNLGTDTLFIRSRAIEVQQKLLTIARYNQNHPKLIIDDDALETATPDDKECKFKPIKPEEYKTKPEVVSLEMRVDSDFSHLRGELDVVSSASGNRTRYTQYNNAYYKDNDNWEKSAEKTGALPSGKPTTTNKSTAVAKTLPDNTKVTEVYDGKNPYEIDALDPTDPEAVTCTYCRWYISESAKLIPTSIGQNPVILPGKIEGEKVFVRLFKVPHTLSDFEHLSCIDAFLLFSLDEEAQRHNDYFLEIETNPCVAYFDDANRVQEVDTIGEWLFGPPCEDRDGMNAVTVTLSSGLLTITYPEVTPPQGVWLLDHAVHDLYDRFDLGMFSLVELLQFITDQVPLKDKRKAFEQLDKVVELYGIKYTDGERFDCIDYMNSGYRVMMENVILSHEAVYSIGNSESDPDDVDDSGMDNFGDVYINPEYAECQRALALY